MTDTAADQQTRDTSSEDDETRDETRHDSREGDRHGTDTVELQLGLCRYCQDEEATKMAVHKDGTGWIAVCDEHVSEAENDGFEVRDQD